MKNKLKRIIKISGLVLLVVFIIAQFFRINKTNPPVYLSKDFTTITNPPKHLMTIVKNSCYDCHSNESKYPWYTNLAPVSWIVKNHINEGREKLNFSDWGNYSKENQKELLEEAAEEIEEGEMPLWDYLLMHSEAKLSIKDQKELINWIKTLQVSTLLTKDQDTE